MIESREQALQQRRDEISSRIATFQRRRTWATSIFVFLVVLFTVTPILIRPSLVPKKDAPNLAKDQQTTEEEMRLQDFTKLTLIFYGAIPILFIWNYNTRLKSLRNDLSDIDNQLDLIRIPDQSQEQKAQKLLQIQQFELKRYYDQTLRQSNSIFYVGVITMILGFSVIAWS